MLNRPDLSNEAVLSVLARFELRTAEAIFQPSGDANSAVYRVASNGRRYFLKARCGDFDQIAATVPAWLYAKGISRVMAPITATTGAPWVHLHGFDWMLYPNFSGKNGFESPLSQVQWIALGETIRQVHEAILSSELARRVPRESYSSRYRAIVEELDAEVSARQSFDDRAATQLAKFWMKNRCDIRAVLERADDLVATMRSRTGGFVLCHTDLHAGNVLVSGDDQLMIIDWDNPIFAPKERDLMFVGGGVGGAWNNPLESDWFFAGYGDVEIDPIAIAFYRYERIVVDIAEYGQPIFGLKGSALDRLSGLRKLKTAFLRANVIDVAHQTYSKLS